MALVFWLYASFLHSFNIRPGGITLNCFINIEPHPQILHLPASSGIHVNLPLERELHIQNILKNDLHPGLNPQHNNIFTLSLPAIQTNLNII